MVGDPLYALGVDGVLWVWWSWQVVEEVVGKVDGRVKQERDSLSGLWGLETEE